MSQTIMNAIQLALKTDSGLLIGRFGTVEFEACWEYEHNKSISCSPVLERNAGVFPADLKSHGDWVERTKDAFQLSDVLAVGWYLPMAKRELELLGKWGCNASHVKLRDLEPYYAVPNKRWSTFLQGRSVCVVTSFTESGEIQVAKGEWAIWPGANKTIWPSDVIWSWVKTGYAPVTALGSGMWPSGVNNWRDAVDYVVNSVLRTDARIVLIGCGGLGMCIAAALKKKGRICIVMGGAIQVFLGIKGGRWSTHEYISKLWNDNWIFPSASETPGAADTIERRCYWK